MHFLNFLSSAFSLLQILFFYLLLKPLCYRGSTDVIVCFAFVPAAQSGP